MKLPGFWILAAFAAGIGIAERWPAAPMLWVVVATVAILAGGILATGFFCGVPRLRLGGVVVW